MTPQRPGGTISKTVLTDIKSRIDIVAVIGRHMELKQSGSTFKGCCPFHDEKTPSFEVRPSDGRWKCYGACQVGGDVFDFLKKATNKPFPIIVRELARECGVEVPDRENARPPTPAEMKASQERKSLYAVCEAAAEHWFDRLWGDERRLPAPEGDAVRQVRSYLRARGVSDDTAKAFRIGFALTGYHDVDAALKAKGFDDDAMANAGVVCRRKEAGKGVFDRFRSRLMVPIVAPDGKVIAFGGRAVLDSADGPKYMNSPSSEIYQKSHVLFAMAEARDDIRRSGEAVLVEGYFDAVALHQVGVNNCVAACGTALTPEHVALLQRSGAKSLTLLFDGDDAGEKAPWIAAPVLLKAGMSCKVAVLPVDGNKVDPDEFARQHGREGIEKVLAVGLDLTEYLLEAAMRQHIGASGNGGTVEQRLRVVNQLLGPIQASTGLVRPTFEKRIAKRLDLDVGALRAELAKLVPADPVGAVRAG